MKINIPNLNKEQLQKLLALVAAIALMVILSVALIFKPQLTRMRDYRRKSDDLSQKILTAERKIAQKDALLAKIEKINEALSFYEKRLPREKDIPFLLEELTEIVEGATIEFVSIRPERTSPIESLAAHSGGEGLYLRLPIKTKMKCGFHDLEQFLFKLEKTRRFVKVTDVEIKAGGGPPDNPAHAVKLTIEVYMYQE